MKSKKTQLRHSGEKRVGGVFDDIEGSSERRGGRTRTPKPPSDARRRTPRSMYPRTVCCGSAAIGDGVPGVSCDGATSEPREASAEERRRKGGTVTRLPSQRGRDGSGGGWGPMSSTHHPRGQASLSRSGCVRDDSGEAAAMKPTSCAPAPLGRMRQGRFDVYSRPDTSDTCTARTVVA